MLHAHNGLKKPKTWTICCFLARYIFAMNSSAWLKRALELLLGNADIIFSPEEIAECINPLPDVDVSPLFDPDEIANLKLAPITTVCFEEATKEVNASDECSNTIVLESKIQHDFAGSDATVTKKAEDTATVKEEETRGLNEHEAKINTPDLRCASPDSVLSAKSEDMPVFYVDEEELVSSSDHDDAPKTAPEVTACSVVVSSLLEPPPSKKRPRPCPKSVALRRAAKQLEEELKGTKSTSSTSPIATKNRTSPDSAVALETRATEEASLSTNDISVPLLTEELHGDQTSTLLTKEDPMTAKCGNIHSGDCFLVRGRCLKKRKLPTNSSENDIKKRTLEPLPSSNSPVSTILKEWQGLKADHQLTSGNQNLIDAPKLSSASEMMTSTLLQSGKPRDNLVTSQHLIQPSAEEPTNSRNRSKLTKNRPNKAETNYTKQLRKHKESGKVAKRNNRPTQTTEVTNSNKSAVTAASIVQHPEMQEMMSALKGMCAKLLQSVNEKMPKLVPSSDVAPAPPPPEEKVVFSKDPRLRRTHQSVTSPPTTIAPAYTCDGNRTVEKPVLLSMPLAALPNAQELFPERGNPSQKQLQ